ncbi:hypothetical protein CHARACLAT_020011 [Characodon lateralis]|uniref:Secreted protein n=1 Tax=Characodon lateralis TaxID=208331 RepID=A0ABU7EVA1_9TELE|nr:hypothetical protein [Characodon lateralis]
MCPGVSGSMAALALMAAGEACGLVDAAPWGFCTVAVDGSTGALLSLAVVPGFLRSGGGIRCGSDLLHVYLGGQVYGSSHSLLHIFMEKLHIHKHAHNYTHRSLDSGFNR